MASGGLRAKGWRRPVGVMAILAVFAWQVPLLSQPRPPREAGVRLSWQPGWTSAGISVEPGDTLSIRVRTIKAAASEAQQGCERNVGGAIVRCQQEDPKEKSLADSVLNFAARQAIVGRLGEGKPFVVGRNFKKVMKAGGPLSLRWNVPREAAGAAQGFNVAIRVEPGSPKGDGGGVEGNSALTNTTGTGGSSGNSIDTNSAVPTNNAIEIDVNGVGVAPGNDQGNDVGSEENVAVAVDPIPPGPPEEASDEDADRNVSASDPETRLSTAQLALLAAALAALLLVLAAAGVGVQRWRRRRLADRTRARLSVSPSLDLGEGHCRGGGRPAEGPAASLRARLEEGAAHMSGGGGDG